MNRVPVFRPTIRREGMDDVLSCIVSDEIGPGKRGQDLAAAVASALGMAGGIALADYGLALSCALSAASLETGARVICSALAPHIHRKVIERCGLVPLIVDADADSGVLDLELADQVHGKAGAIMIDHTLGFIPNFDLLRSWQLPVIEDLTCSFGGYEGETAQDLRGEVAVLSLGQTGLLTAGSGALLLCRTKALMSSVKRIAADCADPLADLNAALALGQLKRYRGDMDVRRSIRDAYHSAITRTRHRTLSSPSSDGNVNQIPFSYPVVVADGVREVARYAAKAGVETMPAYEGSIAANLYHDEEAIAGNTTEDSRKDDVPDGGIAYPVADSLWRRCVLFPLYPLLGVARVATISKVLATLP